ncbi:MAG: hypothetical protein H6541_07275 [Lentimicrobiaceae bacterium]|nr:hypothetical protein [Lentimicrobiaceae bacterium]
MLKKLALSGVITHLLILVVIVLILFFTPQVSFSSILPPLPVATAGTWLYGWLSANPLLLKPLSIALLLVISLLFNAMLIRHEVGLRSSLFPAVMTMLLMLYTPDAIYLIITEVSLLLLMVSMHNILNLYGEQSPKYMILNATMAVAVASMFIPELIVFTLFVWFGMFTYRINSWREWVISILGLLIPYIYLAFFYFWNDNLAFIIAVYENYFRNWTFHMIKPATMPFITLCALAFTGLISLARFLTDASEKIISLRKKMWITAQFAFAGVGVIIIAGSNVSMLLPVLFLPMAAALSYTIINSRRTWFMDAVILLALLTIIANRINV